MSWSGVGLRRMVRCWAADCGVLPLAEADCPVDHWCGGTEQQATKNNGSKGGKSRKSRQDDCKIFGGHLVEGFERPQRKREIENVVVE